MSTIEEGAPYSSNNFGLAEGKKSTFNPDPGPNHNPNPNPNPNPNHNTILTLRVSNPNPNPNPSPNYTVSLRSILKVGGRIGWANL